jgi:hypothetical protein
MDEIGGACHIHGEKYNVYTAWWWGNLRARDHLGDPVIDGRIILKLTSI